VIPDLIHTEAELEEVLTQPSPQLVEFIRTLSGRLLILGAGGKMGPTLAVLARRAADAGTRALRVTAVSRFSEASTRSWLETRGVETLGCDLLDGNGVRQLPDAEHVLYLVGMKFGTTRDPAATWALNTLVPARVCERYPGSRIVALSTGNVYPLSDVRQDGSREGDALTPLGEYANAAVGRERVFEFCSRRAGTRLALLRLCYAIDLRYGVLADLARWINAGQPVPLTTGYFNCIWQGDANEIVLRALALAESPPTVWNLCRPERFPVREIANRLGELMGRSPRFAGEESATALLADPARICAALGCPRTPMETLLRWTAHWAKPGARDFGKPTHFEVRDGKY
jgi:dTDP-4-dehydrorhamnose reductase